MNKLRRIINNTAISLTGQLITWVSTLLLTIAYGRFLGDVKFGTLYFAITFVLLIGIPIEQGFNPQITRDVAQEPRKASLYLSNTLFLKCMLWCILYSLLLLCCWIFRFSEEIQTLLLICGITLLCSAITSTFASLHYAFERTLFPAIGTILEKGTSALFGIILLKNGMGIEGMALILLGGSLLSMIWQGGWFFRLNGTYFRIDLEVCGNLLRTGIPFLAYGVLGVLYYRLDTILLSFMTTSAVVGWYGAGYRIFDTLIFLPSLVIGAIMYPVFSKFSLSSEADLRLAIEKSMNFLLVCIIPIATFMICTAPAIIGFLYHHSEFEHTIPVLQALAPGLIFLYINTIQSTVIVSLRQERKMTITAGIALIFNLTLNLVMIPHYQQVGAAIVTSFTEVLLSCILFLFMPKRFLPLRSCFVAMKAAIASLIMGITLIFLQSFNVIALLAVAIPTYLLIATLLKTIPGDDLVALSQSVLLKASKVTSPSPHNVNKKKA